MRSTLLAALATTLAAGISGCVETTSSDFVKSKVVYQNYRVTYSEADSMLTGWAQFTVNDANGTAIKLEPPASIKLNGMNLTRIHVDELISTHYTKDWAVSPSAGLGEHYWEFFDQDNRLYRNTVTVVPVKVEALAPVFEKSSRRYHIVISGPALSAQDRFEVQVYQSSAQKSTAVTFDAVAISSNTLELKPSGRLPNDLAAGTARLQLSRFRTLPLQQAGPQGGTMTAGFTATPITIEVRE